MLQIWQILIPAIIFKSGQVRLWPNFLPDLADTSADKVCSVITDKTNA